MNKAFGTAFFRFRRSKTPILVFAFVAVILLSVLVGLTVGASNFVPDPDFGKDTTLWEGEEIPYDLYNRLSEERLTEELKKDDLTEEERHDIEMRLAAVRYYIDTGTDREDYYDMSRGFHFGGAYWMQVLFMAGALASMLAPLALTAWFFPGAKSGVFRTEFLTGTPRRPLWTGKTGASTLISPPAPTIFSAAMLVCAACSPDVKFFITDELLTRAYAISVFAQWIAETAAMYAVALLASALVNFVTCLSDDTAIGVAVPSVIILALTFGMFIILNIMPQQTAVSDDSLLWVPFLGTVTAFDAGATREFGIAVAIHFAAAAVCYAASYLAFRRKSL